MATLEELQARITRLNDIKEVEKLQKIYGYYQDYGEWQKIVDLFTDDGPSVEEADLSSRPLDILTLSFVFIDIPGSFVSFWGRQTRSPEDGGPLLDGPTPRPPDQFAARVATRPYADGAKFREQSQNVYENKGKGQEVRESGPRYGGAIGRGLTTFGPSTKMRLGLRALSKMDGFSTLRLAES